MNLEAQYILDLFGLGEDNQAYILTGAVRDNIENDDGEWQGFVTQIKTNTKQEIARLDSKIDTIAANTARLDAKIDANAAANTAELKSMLDAILQEIRANK